MVELTTDRSTQLRHSSSPAPDDRGAPSRHPAGWRAPPFLRGDELTRRTSGSPAKCLNYEAPRTIPPCRAERHPCGLGCIPRLPGDPVAFRRSSPLPTPGMRARKPVQGELGCDRSRRPGWPVFGSVRHDNEQPLSAARPMARVKSSSVVGSIQCASSTTPQHRPLPTKGVELSRAPRYRE